MPILASALTPKGINFTYTADPDDLNPENLAKFDVLALYANHDSISPAQEKALLNYVKSGKGFLPIHCASYCFRNSEAFVSLVGAQFHSHKTATFTAKITQPENPLMQDISEFETWDETYVHHLHNEDREVLMERVEGDHVEPWTWTRRYGKGRVFYTAYGHDERTWSHPGFQALMEKAVLWLAGDRLSDNLAKLSFPTLEYTEAKIPNYEKRDPPPKLQTPLSVEESQSLIQIPPGFELSLFAAEPDIGAPVAMTWDEKGRLWLLETSDYPNDINLEDGKGNDKIKILEDTNGDGRADKFTVFADNLSVPTSLVFYQGGVVVSQAPHFLFLKDEDGDDKADVRKTIMTGWGTFDTHAGPSNLKYGFDNWLWGTVGYSSFEGMVGGDSLQFRQGVYRFQGDGSQMEFMGATSNNTWGLGFSETFDIFASTANNTHSAYLGIPHAYFQEVAGISGREVKKIDGHYFFHPITQNVRQVDVFGGFTAAAGHNLYTARSFPKEYWNRIAFICEPTGHLLHRAVMEKDGAGFKEKDDWNMLASADEWVSPVHAEVGPDGALWILDWYNFIIQHNPTPPGFDNGKGNAHINPLRDKQHGRIYRLAYKKAKNSKTISLDANNPAQLTATLKNDNLLWRMHAQRLLVERGEKDVLEDLFAIIENTTTDEIGLNSPAVHALWTLHGLGVLDGSHQKALRTAETALKHPAAGVRKAAVQVLPKTQQSLDKMLAAGVLDDPDAHTRLAAILTLADLPALDNIGGVLLRLSQDETLRKDEWLGKAVYVAMTRHKNQLIETLYEEKPDLLAEDLMKEEEAPDWLDLNLDVSAWGELEAPGPWERSDIPDLNGMDGILWYRKEINLNAAEANSKATLHLAKIDDTDDAYVNGIKVGGLKRAWDTPRIYTLRSGLLKEGKNVIAIRVSDSGGRGGIYGAEEDLFLQLGENKKSLSGVWKFKIEEVFRSEKPLFSDGETPLSLFLKNYGPYADMLAKKLEAEQEAEAAPDQQIELKTIPGQMKYDLETFTVTAGNTVEIVFENNDDMQHNLLIVQSGGLEVVGAVADKMAQSPDGLSRGYVPDIPQVLAATILVDPNTTYTLRFTAPAEPGDYPFVCTFPGHWRTMNGVMKVVGRAAQ